MSLSIIFCSISLIIYIQLIHSSNMKNMIMRKGVSIVFLILGIIINSKIGMVFSVFFLSLYMNNMIKILESSFKEGFFEEEMNNFDETLLISNGDSEYYGDLDFPNYDEDMSFFKI